MWILWHKNNFIKNALKYIKTKFFRYLVSLSKSDQHNGISAFAFVPDLPMTEEWTDEKFYKHFNLTKEEIEHIENKIAPMD